MENKETPIQKTYWKVYPYATGIKKRCRKLERHQLDAIELPIDATDAEIAQRASDAIVAQMKNWNFGSTVASCCYIEATRYDGHTIERWAPFGGKDKRIALNVVRL